MTISATEQPSVAATTVTPQNDSRATISTQLFQAVIFLLLLAEKYVPALLVVTVYGGLPPFQ
jgi:hypothetical protein